jgi:hypothetical protein
MTGSNQQGTLSRSGIARKNWLRKQRAFCRIVASSKCLPWQRFGVGSEILNHSNLPTNSPDEAKLSILVPNATGQSSSQVIPEPLSYGARRNVGTRR